MKLNEYIKEFSSVCWYPSAGNDFREMMILSSEYAKTIGWKETLFPDCFVLTDYQLRENLRLTENGNDKTVLFQDDKTMVIANNTVELETLSLPFYPELVDFDIDENYGRVFSSEISIESSLLGTVNTTLIYVVSENTSFAFDFLIKNRITVDYVIHVRYGHAFGGGKSNGMFIKCILKELGARYFVSDTNSDSGTDMEAYAKYGNELRNCKEAHLQEVFSIPSEIWSNSGDVWFYRVN